MTNAKGPSSTPLPDVYRVADCGVDSLRALVAKFDMQLIVVADGAIIDGSYWGESEAGLIEDRLYVRMDTPVHSALHEACHFICMDSTRRNQLDRDAGGDYEEENAVCYLQILLADELPNCSRRRMQNDMDVWGYTFRLGSSRAWFEEDASDARDWLRREQLIDAGERVQWRVRA